MLRTMKLCSHGLPLQVRRGRGMVRPIRDKAVDFLREFYRQRLGGDSMNHSNLIVHASNQKESMDSEGMQKQQQWRQWQVI